MEECRYALLEVRWLLAITQCTPVYACIYCVCVMYVWDLGDEA